MPWKETCVVDEKMAFIGEWLRGELAMTVLCARMASAETPGTGWSSAISGKGPRG